MLQKSNNPWFSLMILLILTLVISFSVQLLLLAIPIFKQGSLDLLLADGANFNFIQDSWYLYFMLAGGSIATFFLPALALQHLEKAQEIYFPKERQPVQVYAVVFLFLLAFNPTMSLISEWNMQMKLPELFKNLESWMRAQEDAMATLTEKLVMVVSWEGLLANLLVMAIIPAIVEEYYFRGVLQNIAQRVVVNPHLAIFITAVIFSVIHLQFYGFFPRLLLGVFFGYLLWWSNNIWIPIFAHFVNNASVTIIAFTYARQGKTYQDLMSMESYSIFTYIASFIISCGLGYLIVRLSNKKQGKDGTKLDKGQDIYQRN